jgi:hypothetical protein
VLYIGAAPIYLYYFLLSSRSYSPEDLYIYTASYGPVDLYIYTSSYSEDEPEESVRKSTPLSKRKPKKIYKIKKTRKKKAKM